MAVLPPWAVDLLSEMGREVQGILEYPISKQDSSIAYYEGIGGAHFLSRTAVPYAMSSLDTPVYHRYLAEFGGENPNVVVADIGGGDGRNALPWLERGFSRVVVVDPVRAALLRLRDWVTQNRPEWLSRLLLIRAEARKLPLRSTVAQRVFAIESLYYLNEDEPVGVAECVRILAPGGRFLIADRDWEGALLSSLLYNGGIGPMLDMADGRDTWDGVGADVVRNRTTTEPELRHLLETAGLEVLSLRGISAFSLIVGFLRSVDRLGPGAEARLPQMHNLLQRLGEEGRFRRALVAVAKRRGDV